MNKSITEIRQEFLDFFYRKGHKIVANSSLLLKDDPTLLFTNAGMNQFKNVFLGRDKRAYSRAATSQRCIRVGGKHNDLENVGYTTRHHTFFEMLGNFSFGDYFKKDAIQYAWELLTSKKWFNLSKERLLVTVYKDDEESYTIWKKEIGIPSTKIIRISNNKGALYDSDNFWKMGDTGPCGPCTEIFYDYGDHICGSPPGSIGENGNRYIEIWNIVFMEFNRYPDGTIEPLCKPSVDTGMGLERITSVLQCTNSNYDIDLFHTLIRKIAKIIGSSDLQNKSFRVIADHIRSCTFLIAEGIMPSNENHGYVLRRIIRRAIFHGTLLGVKDIFFYKLVNPLIEVMDEIGEEIKYQQVQIEQVLKNEEEQFVRTLDHGLYRLNKEIEKINGNFLDGETIFRLYDTYGFPIDLINLICRDRNIKVDELGFKLLMEKQRYRARRSSKFITRYHTMIHTNHISKFCGYNHLTLNSNVIGLFVNGKEISSINDTTLDQDVVIILDRTPFYSESGGQIGDKGELRGHNFIFIVNDTKKYNGQAICHFGKIISGSLNLGDKIQAVVDKSHRTRIQLNHSATHLVYAALKKVIGLHVLQKGSLINDKMLRFDFSHFKAMQSSEIYEVEKLVNIQIRRNLLIESSFLDIEDEKIQYKSTFFDKNCDKNIRIVRIGDFSTEYCIGTHTERTGDIGLFRIISERSVSSGIRRIEAITGEEAIGNLQEQKDQLYHITKLLKSDSYNLVKKITNILERIHQLEKELRKLKELMVSQRSENLFKDAIEVKNVKLLVKNLPNVDDHKILRTIVNTLKNRLDSSIIILGTVTNSTVNLVAGVSNNITDRIKAKELINMLIPKINGKGGGRSDIAQATGTNSTSLNSALADIERWIKSNL